MKNQIIKKMTAGLLTGFLCLSMLTGCGTESGTAEKKEAAADESRKITLCMSQIRWGMSTDEKMMEAWKKVVEEATNTEIEMIAPGHNDYKQNLNVMVSSGNIPDVMLVQNAPEIIPQYANRGYLLPVTEYMEKDSRFEKAHMRNLGLFKSGNDIYGIPTGNLAVKIFWFRKDMVEKYGLNIKETMSTDEFMNELLKVDQNEVIPFGFPKHIVNFQIFYSAFGTFKGIGEKDGKYIDGMQTEEMKTALSYLKELYDRHLMDFEFITNENSSMREKMAAGKYASDMDYVSMFTFYSQSSDEVGAPTEFIPVYTLVGPEGDKGNLCEEGNEAFAISANCKNVDAALDVIHWLRYTEEGNKLINLGVEGVHYDVIDGEMVPRQEAVDTGYAPDYGGLKHPFAPELYDNLDFVIREIPKELMDKRMDYAEKAASEEYLGKVIYVPYGKSKLYDENAAAYNAFTEEMVTKIIMGTQTMEEAYQEYDQFWRSIDGNRILEELNAEN